MSDALLDLKEKLAATKAQIGELKRYSEDLQLAIAAIEGNRTELQPSEANQKLPRGAIQKAVLDALRGRALVVSDLVTLLRSKGISTNANRVSNVISRLQRKKLVAGGPDGIGWTAAESYSRPSMAPGIAKGPSETERPLHLNGEAGSHPA